MKVVVPYPPGGITDLLGRVLADILAKEFPAKPVIVENKGAAPERWPSSTSSSSRTMGICCCPAAWAA